MKTISISVLSGSTYFFSHLAEEIARIEGLFMQAKRALNAKGCKVDFSWHIDIMDGQYVKNLSFEPKLLETFLSVIQWPADVHCMTDSIERYQPILGQFQNLKHCYVHLGTNAIYELESPYDLTFNPNEQIVAQLLPETSSVLLMSVTPGKGCQQFIDISGKISQVKAFDKAKTIAVDGGVNEDTIERIKEADIAVVGSAFMKVSADAQLAYLIKLGELFAD